MGKSLVDTGNGPAAEVQLPSGRSLSCESAGGEERVIIRGVQGEIELEVVLTANGPLLRFRAAEVEIESQGRFGIQCGEFELRSSGSAVLALDGNLIAAADGMDLEATRGDVRVRANDDVRLNGERVKLNCK